MSEIIDKETVEKELCNFIASNILSGEKEVKNDTVLSDIGVDSFSIIEIILFIERRFGIAIPHESLNPENLRSVSALADCTLSFVSK